jgi:hypothetical protein
MFLVMICTSTRLETGYEEMLEDQDMFYAQFCKHLDRNAELQQRHQSQKQTVSGLLCLIDFVFDMFQEIGLLNQYLIYNAVKKKNDAKFQLVEGLNECMLSHLSCVSCIRVDANIIVHEQYNRWLQCLWLVTHIYEVEQENCMALKNTQHVCVIGLKHSEIYRKCFCLVIQSLQNLYEHVVRVNKNNNYLIK